MKAVWILSVKELRDGLRNRWVVALILALAALALTLALLGAAPGGAVKASALSVTVVSLASLTVYLLPLIALMISHDAVVGELERGTLPLLLSFPVSRRQVLLGKFLGHLSILAIAILLGYGSAAAAIALLGGADAEGWTAFGALAGSSILLGAAFLALGYLLSSLADERGKAAGLAIGLWLLLVVIYDLALLGVLLVDAEQSISPGLFSGLLLANPTDAFRLFNLTLVEATREAGGLAGLAAESLPHAWLPLAVLALWTALPLLLANAHFARKEI